MSLLKHEIHFRKSMLANFRIRVLFAFLVAMCIFGVLLTVYQRSDVRSRLVDEESLHDLGIELLEDILQAKLHPRPGKSIFFHETSFFGTKEALQWKMVKLNARQACAVESAALHNPNTQVFVLYAVPRYKNVTGNEAILDALLSYENVYLRNLNAWTYTAHTPIFDWFRGGALFNSSFIVEHASDFIRYVTLWRWGGTHLDMDTVVLRSMEDLPPNYTGVESTDLLNEAIMNFDSQGLGRDVASQCLENFQHNFDGTAWGHNGPGVITRVMQNVCGTKNIGLMLDPKRCLGFKVYPTEAFYAIPWQRWTEFFEPDMLNQTMERIKNSYVAHVWNKMSGKRSIKVGTKCAYSLMAEMHCPRVYKATGLYF